MLCDSNKELLNSQTNNYPVSLLQNLPFQGDYVCWNNYFDEPAMEARIVASAGGRTWQFRPVPRISAILCG